MALFNKTDRYTGLLLLLLIVIVFIINLYTPLFSDDYLYSFKFNKGFVAQNPSQVTYERIHSIADYYSSLQTLYQNLTGRIVAHGMLQFMLLFPPYVFDFMNTVALFFLSFLMVKWVKGSDRQYMMQYVFLTFTLFYIAIARTSTNVYIAAFSCNYIWTQLLILSFLYPFRCHFEDKKYKSDSQLFVIMMFVSGLLAGDTNEPVIPGVILFLFLYIAYCFISKRYVPLWMLSGFAGLTLGFAFLFFAPGNSQRLLYETGYQRGSGRVGFNLQNYKQIIFLSLSALPAFLAAIVALFRFRKPQNTMEWMPLAAILVILSGTLFSLFFVPFITNRFNLLFVSLYVMLALYLIHGSNFRKPLQLLIIVLCLSPLLIGKLFYDLHRSYQAHQEYELFEQEISQAASDSVLVTPRGIMDPITRKNWAKPIATYYGLKSLWVYDVLDSTFWKKSRLVSTNNVTYSSEWKADNLPILSGLRYNNHNEFCRTVYIDLSLDSLQYQPSLLKLNYYSLNVHNKGLKSLYNRLQKPFRNYLMKESGEYRDMPIQIIKGGIRIAVTIPLETNASDFVRLRLNYQGRKVGDILLKDIRFN